MEHRTRARLNTQIYEEAIHWFVESRAGDLNESSRRELDQWLRRSPEHLAAYLEIAAIWNEGPTLDPHGKYETEALIRDAAAEADNVVPLTSADLSAGMETMREERLSSRAPRRVRAGLGRKFFPLAAALAAVAVGGFFSWQVLRDPTYTTDIGEQRSLVLADGSVIELNSRSKVRVHYTEHERDVDLLEGQALFRVAHDTARPFIVSADGTRVRAVGTEFDVYRKSVGTIVTVVEGRVAVFTGGSAAGERADSVPATAGTNGVGTAVQDEPLRGKEEGKDSRKSRKEAASVATSAISTAMPGELLLAAGEQLTVTPTVAEKTEHPNIASATAWTQRQLVFDSATLIEVAEEFNRYNHRQLVIQDPTLFNFHISGVFSSTDPDSLIRFLRTRPGLSITETPDRVTISAS
jgi:transmembrane sensor